MLGDVAWRKNNQKYLLQLSVPLFRNSFKSLRGKRCKYFSTEQYDNKIRTWSLNDFPFPYPFAFTHFAFILVHQHLWKLLFHIPRQCYQSPFSGVWWSVCKPQLSFNASQSHNLHCSVRCSFIFPLTVTHVCLLPSCKIYIGVSQPHTRLSWGEQCLSDLLSLSLLVNFWCN